MIDSENNTPNTEALGDNSVTDVSSEVNTPVAAESSAEDCVSPVQSAGAEKQSVADELRELAYLEASSLDYLPKPVGTLRRREHLFSKLFFTFLIIFVILFFVTARLVFGRGWIENMINGSGSFQSFTIPTVKHPELEDKFYQPDGRYTVEGIAEACTTSLVTIEAYQDRSVLASYGQGSGIIMTEDGYIITNAHVVDNGGFALIVRLHDGTEYNATIIGSDKKSDIAVIKINAEGLSPAQFGDSNQLVRGEQVVALGSPAGFESSITTGVVSGLDRKIKIDNTSIGMSCIQMDAAINPGSSGGALFNMWGQVVGITSSKMKSAEYDNICFAISMDAAKPIIEELIEHGSVLGRPKIGISFYEVSETMATVYGIPAGLHIAAVSPDCDVANTDLKPDDVITEMNGIKVTSSDDVFAIILNMHPGDEITAKVLRMNEDGSWNDFTITFKLMEDTGTSIQPEAEDESGDENVKPNLPDTPDNKD